jgi:hypothetical protein
LPAFFTMISGPGTLNGDFLDFTGSGTVVVAADQSGNSFFNAGTRVTWTITVQKANQTIAITDPGTQTFGTSPLTLSAITIGH